ncbi:MAG: MBL fold metallo-hydrolase [Alphaproteobacteria bacterium]
MTSLLHPQLVHEPFGDPGLYVECLFENRAFLIDLGDLQPLSSRKLLRVSHVFVTHTHMDHFSGFDRLLRVCLGRAKRLHLFGPPGFGERVHHKLAAYTWNLVRYYETDFTIWVGEIRSADELVELEFRCRNGFEPEATGKRAIADGVILDEANLRIRTTFLDHDIPCLAFAIEEKQHVNVWKNRVEEMGFRVGPWLRELKQAVGRDEPEDKPFPVRWREDGAPREAWVPLGVLKAQVLRIVPGQKVTYVTDVVYHRRNEAKIVELARGSHTLFIETPFMHEDADKAARKRHLTTRQAGAMARKAEAKRMVPFHFSPRYTGREDDLRREALAAFEHGQTPR